MPAAKPSFRLALYAMLAMAIVIFFLQSAGLLSGWRHALEAHGLSRSGVNAVFGIGAGLTVGLILRLASLFTRQSADGPEPPTSVAARMKSRLPPSPKYASPDDQDS